MPRPLRAPRYVDQDDDSSRGLALFLEHELPYLDYHEARRWYAGVAEETWPRGFTEANQKEQEKWRRKRALIGCNDRYWLLTGLLGRNDLLHPWLFDRCREVEAEPDGHIDLWARFHGKSSIITTGGIIQEVLTDPDITIVIFSVTKPIAREFLGQIKNEFEVNEGLKYIYQDVLYANPRGRDEITGERPAKWSLERGITVRRKHRPKEATIEAHGLIDGQPTGRHFNMHVYDDVVTQDHLADEQLKKCTARFEMADNLGTRHGVRKWIAGTRYHFADTYGVIIDRGSAKPRIYAATEDGTLNATRTIRGRNGQPDKVVPNLVLLTEEHWAKIKRDQGLKTTNAQMLLNPVAGSEATFRPEGLRPYEVVPRLLNVYILVDPSKGSGQRSDRTAIPVIGIDTGGSKYLLDGVCHRMKLSERWKYVKQFKAYWEGISGVQMVRVGWERYGMQVDIEVVEDMMMEENNHFPIEELNTPKQGGHSKNDRIERLEPDIRNGRFYIPCTVYNPDMGSRERGDPWRGICYWSIWADEDQKNAERLHQRPGYHVGQIVYRPAKGLTKAQMNFLEQKSRIVTPLRHQDENKEIYDLTRMFMDELIRHPFAAHDDLIDAVSRIYDIDPQPPQAIEAKSTEGVDIDDSGIIDHSSGEDYEDA